MNKYGTYAAITALCVVVLLLFQLIGMSLGLFDSDYEINKYAANQPVSANAAEKTVTGAVAVIGSTSVAAVDDACYYLGRTCTYYSTLTDEALQADMIVWADSTLTTVGDLPKLRLYSQTGGTLIFAQIPSVAVIQANAELRALLGIESIVSFNQKTKGIRLYDGFLLGGEKTYEKMSVTAPWFSLTPGYSVYLSGFVDKPSLGDKARTMPLLWRTRTQEGLVFVCNNRWLLRSDGIGLVYAILSKTMDYCLYPVINAQTMSVQNFPYLSNENRETMHSWYHQTSDKLFFNALLPTSTAVFNNLGYPFTCLFTGSFDGETSDDDIDWNELGLYIRLIVGRSGEMGLSGFEHSGALAEQKLTRDLAKLGELARAYTLTVFAPNGMSDDEYAPLLADGQLLEDIRTVLLPMTDGGDVLRYSFASDRVLNMPLTHDGFAHDDEADLALRSLETALVASNLSVDMKTVLCPQSADDDWAILSRSWSENLFTSWKPYETLDKLCLSDADRRARTFLNLRYTVTEDGDTLRIHIDDFQDTAYFVIRREDIAVEDCVNVTSTTLEDGALMLSVTAADASFTLTREHRISFY